MKKHRYPTIVKVIITITFSTFIIASLSPDFMFEILGISNMEPFGYMYPNIHAGTFHADDHIRAIRDQKEHGIFGMLALLVIFLVFYISYRILKLIYNHYKTTNKDDLKT